jgi:ParB/RepB/Spo0J family partition protein
MAEQLRDICVEDIVPDPGNLRRDFDQADVEALGDNLAAVGQTDPIQVFVRGEEGDRIIYDLFDGERRWRAAKLKGIEKLKAIVIPRPSDADLLVRRISRMMQTRDYTFQEQIHALESGLRALNVLDDPSKWGKVAPKLGVKPEELRERMRVLSLSPNLQERFFANKVDYTIAQQLGRLADHQRQEAAAKFIADHHLSNRFVTAKFTTALIKNPDRPLIEVYDIARKDLADAFYAKTRLTDEIPRTLQQEIDHFLDSVMSIEKLLEKGARDGFFREAFERDFDRHRIIGCLVRLKNVIAGFLSATDDVGRSTVRTLSESDRKLLKETNEKLGPT